MTTYPEYIAQCQRHQRDYITAEQERMAKADKLFGEYATAMARIGLHPLTESEIVSRVRELFGMAGAIEETHGDSPAMRAAYQMQFGREAEL